MGFSVATTSLGAGALGVTIFPSLMGSKAAKNLVGTDIVHAIPVTLVAGTSNFAGGFVDLELLAFLLLGSIPGASAGAKTSKEINTNLLRKTLAVVLLSGAVGAFFKNRGNFPKL